MGILVGDFGFFHNFDPEILDFSGKIDTPAKWMVEMSHFKKLHQNGVKFHHHKIKVLDNCVGRNK